MFWETPRNPTFRHICPMQNTPSIYLIISIFLRHVNTFIYTTQLFFIGFLSNCKTVTQKYIILIMKKFTYIFMTLFPFYTFANPMFGDDKQNSIGIHIAQSTGHGDLGHLVMPADWRIEPMTTIMLEYSQPINLLRLPGRINIHALQNFAYHSADGRSFGAIGISWDIAFLSWCDFYLGAGLGPYMRDSGDDYVTSRLVFGERVFIGYRFNNRINAEIFTLHFSNGDFTETNHGFNFIGTGFRYSF